MSSYEEFKEEYDIVTFMTEDGKEEHFFILEEYKYKKEVYYIVTYADENANYNEDVEIFFLKLDQEDGEDMILSFIEDEDEFNEVAASYEKLLEEE